MKRGDKVVCIDAEGPAEGKLVNGMTYTVMAVTITGEGVSLEGAHSAITWGSSRFEVVK